MKGWPFAILLAASGAQAQATPASSAAAAQPLHTQEQVTVTAERSSAAVGETGRTTYVLSAEDLDDYPAVTLDESLRQHAGFELFRRAPSRVANPTSEGISLRGLGSTAASRTLVLEDGAPLNDPFGGYVHWSETPAPAVGQVVLVSGGGSDLYGSSALGGVVDVLPAAESPAGLELSAQGGSEDTSDATLLARGITHLAGALAAAESLRTGGYVVTAPASAGAVDIPANVASQTARLELGRRNFAPRHVFLTSNLPNEARDNGTPLQTNATRLWRYLAAWETPESSRIAARVRAFGSEEGYRQSFSAIAASRNSETLTRLQRVHTQELGAAADATLHAGAFAFVAGADLRDIRAEDNETPFSGGQPSGAQNVTARQRFTGGFLEGLASRGAWSGAASIRVDSAMNLDVLQMGIAGGVITRAAPPNRTEIVPSPRLGLVRTFRNGLAVHAEVFRAFREPTMNELYRTGQVGQETTLPNSGLTSERGTGWELGAGAPASKALPFAWQATWFWTAINRPVAAVPLSQTATTITEMRENLGQIRSQGVELAATLHPGKAISVTAGYQFADAVVTRFPAQPALVGNWIPQVPRSSFTSQLRVRSARAGLFTVAARASGHAFDDAANQFPLAGFFQLDAFWTRNLGSRLAVTLLGQNLTDRRQQVSRTPVLTLGSPVFVEAGLRLRVGK